MSELNVVAQHAELTGIVERAATYMRRWKPATSGGVPVKQYFNLPVEWKETAAADTVDESATPMGGMAVLYKELNRTIRYPPQAYRKGVSGRVFVEFVINSDASMSDVKVSRGIGAGCDEEAIRAVKASTVKWIPGKSNLKPVRSRMVLPITFGK